MHLRRRPPCDAGRTRPQQLRILPAASVELLRVAVDDGLDGSFKERHRQSSAADSLHPLLKRPQSLKSYQYATASRASSSVITSLRTSAFSICFGSHNTSGRRKTRMLLQKNRMASSSSVRQPASNDLSWRR